MFAWVILHYQEAAATKSEVDHIKAISKDASRESRIIIVDNASPNGSGRELSEIYRGDSLVTVICLSSNVGFAQGNNAGYRAALELRPEFIVVTNNDIEIKQASFFDIVERDYQENKFAVLGPDIFVPATETHQNPKPMKNITTEFVQQQINKNMKLASGNLLTSIRANIKQINWLRKLVVQKRVNTFEKVQKKNVVLHGSFMVLSQQFFLSFTKWAFYPDTFFYYEMEIQYILMQPLNLVTLYDPQIQVFHFQGISTSKRFARASAKLKFQSTQMVKSGKVFLDVASQLKDGKHLV